MAEPIALIFESKEKLVIGFTEHFNKILARKTGTINVALSGGSTPKIWFEYLVKHFSTDIDWNRVHFFWGDERCVPPHHKESNFGMTRTYLLDHITIPNENVHRIQGELDPEVASNLYIEELKDYLPGNDYPVFDLIILGIGDDGHTASIFPHQLDLWDSMNNCVVATHPKSSQKRVSLSGNVINNADSVAFLITGENKAEIVEEIINNKSNASNYPANHVNPYEGELYWFLDSEAASLLRDDK